MKITHVQHTIAKHMLIILLLLHISCNIFAYNFKYITIRYDDTTVSCLNNDGMWLSCLHFHILCDRNPAILLPSLHFVGEL